MAKLLLKTLLLILFHFSTWVCCIAQCLVVANNDTSVCISNPTIQLNALASNTIGYEWQPSTGLNNSRIPNPIAQPKSTTSYIVTAVIPDNTELVANGDFESGNVSFTSAYSFRSNPSPGGSGNLQEGQYTINSDPTKTHQCFSNCRDKTSGSGKMMIFNGSKFPNVNIWTQTINVTPNTDYAFSAWLQNVTCPPYGYNAELQFSINSSLIGNVFRSDSAVCVWKQFYQIWNSGSNTTATISIVNQYTSSDGNDFALDDISFRKLCPAKDTVTITIDVPTHTVSNQICSGDSIFAQGKYRKTSGTYYDTLSTLSGCDSILTTQLSVGSYTSTVDTAICTGDSIYLQKAYRNSAGTFYDTLPSSKGCDSIITTNLSTIKNFLTTTDTTVCNGDSILVNGNYLKVQGNYYDTILSAGNCATINITNLSVVKTYSSITNVLLCGIDSFFFRNSYLKTIGTYFDTVFNAHCIDTLKQLTIDIKPIPITNFEFRLCPDDSIFWNGNFIKTDTIFYDTVSTSTCDSLLVTTVRKVGIPTNLVDTAFYCDDKLAQLDAGAGYQTYTWSDGSSGRYLTTNIDGVYWVQVTDTNNCKFIDSGRVSERCNPVIFVPTAFSPNNDGINDFFYISSSNVLGIKFSIFDRWGEILFETNNPAFIWDGKYKGEALPIGVYHWMANFTGINKESRIVKFYDRGLISIIR